MGCVQQKVTYQNRFGGLLDREIKHTTQNLSNLFPFIQLHNHNIRFGCYTAYP